MKPIILALAAPAIGTIGQLLLKHVMNGIGPIGATQFYSPIHTAFRLLADPLFLVAVLLYCLGFMLWLVVLSRLQLSYAYPILALSYCLVPLLSHLIFGELISPMRWIGIVIICFGVALVGLSK